MKKNTNKEDNNDKLYRQSQIFHIQWQNMKFQTPNVQMDQVDKIPLTLLQQTAHEIRSAFLFFQLDHAPRKHTAKNI